MQEPTYRKLVLIVEYLFCIVVVSILVGILAYLTLAFGPIIFMILGIPSGLFILVAAFTSYSYLRFYPPESGENRMEKSFGVGLLSTALSMPVIWLTWRLLLPPYNYGPGP